MKPQVQAFQVVPLRAEAGVKVGDPRGRHERGGERMRIEGLLEVVVGTCRHRGQDVLALVE